jgi:hypothetical protein
MQYFVRTVEKHKGNSHVFSAELQFPALGVAKAEARRLVQAADPGLRLHADACAKIGGIVRTKYSGWINERGELQECVLV